MHERKVTPVGAEQIAALPLEPMPMGGRYILRHGERFWCDVRGTAGAYRVEVFVYRPFLARLKDAWDVLWGEPRR